MPEDRIIFMLSIERIQKIALQLCAEYDIPAPGIIRYNGRLSATLGRCLITDSDDNHQSIIELNTKFCQINRNEIVIGVLKHELAHLVYFNHGPEFSALCNKMGIQTHTDESFDDVKYPRAKYTYQCPICKTKFHRTQRFKKSVACGECGQKKYIEKNKLVLIDQS